MSQRLRNGIFKTYYSNGKVCIKCTDKNSQKNGAFKSDHCCGRLHKKFL